MACRRFLVDRIRENAAELLGAGAHHLARVLRAQPGQPYEISDAGKNRRAARRGSQRARPQADAAEGIRSALR